MSDTEIQELIQTLQASAQSPGSDWATVIALLLTFVGLLLAAYQLRQISNQISGANIAFRSDHDRTRRERTVEALRYYLMGTKPEHNKMVQLLDRMSDEQLRNLWDAKPVTLSGELKEFACSTLRRDFPNAYSDYCSKEGPQTFSHAESMQLRYVMLNVINHYEICLSPWHLGIADQEAMEEQFAALVDQRDGKYKLDSARAIIGRHRFPATEAFKRHLFPSEVTTSPAKKPLGTV